MLSKDFELFYYNDIHLGDVKLHSHDYYEFYFFIEGEVDLQIGDSMFPVSPGDIFMLPPHVKHRPCIRNQDKPYRRFVFWISKEYCDYLETLSKDYTYLMNYVNSHKDYCFQPNQIAYNELQSMFLRLLEELKENRFGKDAQVALWVNELVLYLNRMVYSEHHPVAYSVEHALYQRIALFIEEHLEEDLSLERLSEIFFVSRYHIAHVFKDNLGMSIHQFITKKRLARCKQAILGSSSITEVYEMFGFGDYSSFYRAFKKEYGISPKDFRDMQKIDTTS